jgi:hypothetical protein
MQYNEKIEIKESKLSLERLVDNFKFELNCLKNELK